MTKYLNVEQLSAESGVSVATIWRLKRERRIRFFQPGGPRSIVLFPPDAFEAVNDNQPANAPPPAANRRLPGATPNWKKSR